MKVIKTVNTNNSFGSPPGKEDLIDDLPCQTLDGELGEGTRVIRSVWKPSEFERKAIASGQNIRLDVGWIGVFPPVFVGITHETEVETKTDGTEH